MGPTKKRHPLWEYFESDNGVSNCKLCKYEVNGQYTTTLLVHLSSQHSKEHARVVSKKAEKDREAKDRIGKDSQPALDFPVVEATKYSENSPQKRYIDVTLARFAGCTSFAYHLVKCPEFKEFVSALNARYALPCADTLKRFVSVEAQRIKDTIIEMLISSGKVTICCDIWTQKNMVAAYLALTAHFFCYKTDQLENVCLAVRLLTSSHTAKTIKEISDEILAEFGLNDETIFRYRADNGSNIVAAFRESVIEVAALVVDADFALPTS
jgi:hypothetical protein